MSALLEQLRSGIVTHSAGETRSLAEHLARLLPRDTTLALHGDLGAGKTTFVQGLALGLGIRAAVTSPTFTIFTVHRGPVASLVHLDAYRLENDRQIDPLMLDDFLVTPYILAVEWPGKIAAWLPPTAWHLTLGITPGQNHTVRLDGRGESRWASPAGEPSPIKNMTYYYDTFPAPFSEFSAAVDETGALAATAFGGLDALRKRFTNDKSISTATLTRAPARLAAVRRQVAEYFAGRRRDFDLPLAPGGTEHQRRVWAALRAIPFGETRGYGDLARALGSSPRAVGRANATNPVSLIVPCHRVIGADGSLTGFAFGEDTKRKLLEHEGVRTLPPMRPRL